MRENSDRGTEKKGRSRVYSAVLSLVFPGLGQMVRGRIFAGLLFFANVVLYFVPLFVTHTVEYRRRRLHLCSSQWVCGSARLWTHFFIAVPSW